MDKKKGGEIIDKEEVVEQVNGEDEDMLCVNCGYGKFMRKKTVTQLSGARTVSIGLPVCEKCGTEYIKPKKENKIKSHNEM